ncbi:hypothetical protein [Klebsiella pneumoniae]|uniref:hypothetical protein n=1 Tax=Klebsiella pneumoniae TaxID=573 RepID=UPI000E3E4F27|nr:hypothetical protein [Klebsiella pneumoniae]
MPENPASYRVVRTKSYLFNKAAQGLNDVQLLKDVKKIRIALRELEHEKELVLHHEPNKLHATQNEAEKSVAPAI